MEYNSLKEEIITKYNLHLSYIKDPDNFIFMNYGYADLDSNNYPIQRRKLSYPYDKWYYQSNLYIKTIEEGRVASGNLLDVSSGRGGGASLCKTLFNFDKVYGLDINPTNIEFSKNKFKGVDYTVGEASNIPFSDNYFNLITCIEASSYFPQIELFLQEAYRVLKPEGILSIVQYSSNDIASTYLNENVWKYKFNIEKEIDITLNSKVASSVDKHRFSYIDTELFEVFSNAENTMLTNVYKIFILKKNGI